MLGCLGWRFADNRHIQASSDEARDLPERDSLFGNTVIRSSRRSVFQRQPEQPCGIEAMHRGPSIRPSPTYADSFLFRAISMSCGAKP